jgi:hypothetical protein
MAGIATGLTVFNTASGYQKMNFFKEKRLTLFRKSLGIVDILWWL